VESAAPAAVTGSNASTARGLLRLLRPHQWTKNLICLAGVIFSGHFTRQHELMLAAATVAVFCAASSSVYAFNDVLDRERDRRHPLKRNRPLASGAVGAPLATAISFALGAAAVAGAFFLGPRALLCLGLYVCNNLAYTLKFKHVALFDVLSVAAGFVLRLLAGCYAVGVLPTSWIVLCTFFLSTFLAFAKRRAELATATAAVDDAAQRPVLAKYSVQYLDSMVNASAGMTVMCYAIFTIFRNPMLVVTVPFVFYGVMHYKRLVMVLRFGEEPDRVVLRDRRIQMCIAMWLATFLLVMLYVRYVPDRTHWWFQ
jgi:4-hydroxybenzoate polyprenyltransferase